MDLKQLQYFFNNLEEGSITAAAARLHVTQPPLSQQLKKLEKEFNVVLFERDSRNFDSCRPDVCRPRQAASCSK